MHGATGWYVGLKGHIFDLRELENQFKVGAIQVAADGGTYYLRATALDEVPPQESSAAGERAADLVQYVNRVMALIVPGFHKVGVEGLHFFSEDGTRQFVERTEAEVIVLKRRELS